MKLMIWISILSGPLSLGAAAHAAGTEPASETAPAETEAMRLPDPRDEDEAIRERLFLAWTFVALNMVGADVLASYLPGIQEDVEKFAGGRKNVKWFMLGGAITYEIPFSMMLLSKFLPRGIDRWVNVGASVVSAAAIIGGGSLEPHNLLMESVEILALSYIIWTALTWPETPSVAQPSHDVGAFVGADSGYVTYSYRF